VFGKALEAEDNPTISPWRWSRVSNQRLIACLLMGQLFGKLECYEATLASSFITQKFHQQRHLASHLEMAQVVLLCRGTGMHPTVGPDGLPLEKGSIFYKVAGTRLGIYSLSCIYTLSIYSLSFLNLRNSEVSRPNFL